MKRHSVVGWVVMRDSILDAWDGCPGSIRLRDSEEAAWDSATGGQTDLVYRKGLKKNGYRCVRVRLTATVVP